MRGESERGVKKYLNQRAASEKSCAPFWYILYVYTCTKNTYIHVNN